MNIWEVFSKGLAILTFALITFVAIFRQGDPSFNTLGAVGGISFLLYLIIETSLGGFKNNENKKEE